VTLSNKGGRRKGKERKEKNENESKASYFFIVSVADERTYSIN
jgi:hypothetical protein